MGAGAGADQGPPVAGEAGVLAPGDPDWRDWAGLPEHGLMKGAGKLVAQNEAGWAAAGLKLREEWTEGPFIQEEIEEQERDGNCLFVFARVCKEWRKAQLKVGGPLFTRVKSDVLRPGSVALVRWALAEGCPREKIPGFQTFHMAQYAAEYGHLALVKWLCSAEGGFPVDEMIKDTYEGEEMRRELMENAIEGGNVELVKWVRAKHCRWYNETQYQYWGPECRWDANNADDAVMYRHVEVLRWLRKSGCPWHSFARDTAAKELGYTDDFGNCCSCTYENIGSCWICC